MDKILNIFLTIPAILIAFTFHEYAHAKVADMLGDNTPKFEGRLTLNPIAHIDPMGFLMILLFRFGWTKPVRTNPSAYKNYYKDDLKVSIAGICANLVVAIVFSILFGIFVRFAFNVLPESYYSVISLMISNIIAINISFAVFNLLPIPGLDGFKILEDLMPKKFNKIGDKLYRYQMLILLGIIFFGGFIISVPVNFLYGKAIKLASIVFTMF
ncbi:MULTISPECIES: site-2 protease family protein [Clostridium]|uniref:Peptidase, M50 family n=1 Tax=Clostridium botulinum (strain Eklund 17B / Type B) TaxID=935198 RepID=B2TNE6_CLOBB|nr:MULTISPECIES: site-2 protease family protein [Clostridium]ACD25029.1 peptidase, M50 family [Clostridium botulinum B str. Eklund 17B (NRP)]MBN1046031.1 site-2 protease family protein [Clostridium botulinum]MBN1055971.1 site-2 protease family protein [Clostridium botulinum]MBY6976078.1 site-2 protease family protein [Clostridium botulinum]MBY7000501.1 site-2 protease family protein [Clostridium botulinum]